MQQGDKRKRNKEVALQGLDPDPLGRTDHRS
jgi:hypothetical protein